MRAPITSELLLTQLHWLPIRHFCPPKYLSFLGFSFPSVAPWFVFVFLVCLLLSLLVWRLKRHGYQSFHLLCTITLKFNTAAHLPAFNSAVIHFEFEYIQYSVFCLCCQTYPSCLRVRGRVHPGLRPCHPEHAQSRLISEAKEGQVWSVLGWENNWEYQVL